MFRIIQLSIFPLILYVPHFSRGNPLSGGNLRHAKPGEFPFIVSLSWYTSNPFSKPEQHHFCGGSLISPKHVLTAAHCFNQVKNPSDIVVKVNDGNLANSKSFKVKKWLTYDKWAENDIPTGNPNDIAVLELSKKVDPSIKPAIISNIPEDDLYGMKAVVAGWGFTKNHEIPRNLLTGTVKILDAHQCISNFKPNVKSLYNDTTHIFICTIDDFDAVKIECGDSGGPLLVNGNEIIAVDKGYCRRKKDDMILERQNEHVSIILYKDFIKEAIRCMDRGCHIQ